MDILTPIGHWIVAHPYECLLLLGAVLSFINGLLPAQVKAGTVGKILHAVLDRLSVLTRVDSPGTLKWPVIGTSIAQQVQTTVVTSVLNPPGTTPTQESK